MTRKKHRAKVLGSIAVTTVSLMAFTGMAQAATLGFLINKKAVGTLEATAGGVQEGEGSYLVPKLNFSIKCPEIEVVEGRILNGTLGDLKLLYKKCKTFSISKPAEELPCHLSDVQSGKPELLHITNSLTLIKPIEFPSGDFGVLATLGEFFLNYLSGTGCPLPLKNSLSGTGCALIEAATNDTTEPLGLASEAIQKSCGAKLLYGVNEAFGDGSAKVFLTGAHSGLTLGVSLIP